MEETVALLGTNDWDAAPVPAFYSPSETTQDALPVLLEGTQEAAHLNSAPSMPSYPSLLAQL